MAGDSRAQTARISREQTEQWGSSHPRRRVLAGKHQFRLQRKKGKCGTPNRRVSGDSIPRVQPPLSNAHPQCKHIFRGQNHGEDASLRKSVLQQIREGKSDGKAGNLMGSCAARGSKDGPSSWRRQETVVRRPLLSQHQVALEANVPL